MQKMEKPRKPLMFYYLIVLVVVILLNTLLFPRLMRQQITQVDYGTFIDMLERPRCRSGRCPCGSRRHRRRGSGGRWSS